MKSSSQAQSNNNANASDSHKETRLADTLFNNKHTDNILTSDESKHGKSICNMKPFDSFGSDYDASVSSMSDSNLSDALHEVVVEDSEGKKNDPQCLLGEGLANCNLAEIEFSFRPEYLEVSNDKIAKPKKMYLSKRLGDKISRLPPLDSPMIRGSTLNFNSIDVVDVSVISDESREKVIKIHRRRSKKLRTA